MKPEMIIPIDTIRGTIQKGGYYFRMYNGKQILQRCPRRWHDTPARKKAREEFVEKWSKKSMSNNQ